MNTKSLSSAMKMIGLGVMVFALQSFTSTTSISSTPQKDKKVKKLELQRTGDTINVSADRLWEIVGTDFANVGIWSTAVDHSVGKGDPEFAGATCTTRGCELNAKGFNNILEELTEFNDTTQQLTFIVIDGMPGFVTSAKSHWEIIALSDSTSTMKIVSSIEMKPFMGSLMGGMLKKNITKIIPTVLDDLKVYAETGTISESKQKRMDLVSK